LPASKGAGFLLLEAILLPVESGEILLQFACVLFNIRRLHRDQRLFEILASFKHVLQMEGGDLQAPRVRERVVNSVADHKQNRMRQRYDTLFEGLIAGRDSKLDVDRIGMPDGNARLEPIKMNLPGAAKRIGPDLELTKILNHLE